MPAPDQKSPWQQAMPSALKKMFEQNQPDLVSEIVGLRKEIAALRSELTPVPSFIVTGRQALDEFKKLTAT